MSDRVPALVMGIGNILWADEGFGVRCVEALDARYQFPAGVQLVDGGTQGLYLVNMVAGAERLLVFDALDYGEPPGTLKVVRDADVPAFAGVRKMSLHQTGMQDVLAAAELMGSPPAHVTLVGVQLANIDEFGGTLSEVVAARLDEALALGLSELERWGFPAVARSEPTSTSLMAEALARGTYDATRLDPSDPSHAGDPRFLSLRARLKEG